MTSVSPKSSSTFRSPPVRGGPWRRSARLDRRRRPDCPAGTAGLPSWDDAAVSPPLRSWRHRTRGGLMQVELDIHSYVQALAKHLQLTLFAGGMADPEGAVLLVRGALADGDQVRAVALAKQTRRLALITPGDPD